MLQNSINIQMSEVLVGSWRERQLSEKYVFKFNTNFLFEVEEINENSKRASNNIVFNDILALFLKVPR